MNVTCGRCGTNYEFETALLSRRGAVVRCTQCHFEFRVRLPGSVVVERWVVRRASGEEYEFESEIELTDAQARGVLNEFDEVSKDGVHFVPLPERASLDVHTSTPPLALRRRTRPPLAHEAAAEYEAPMPAARRPTPAPSYPPVSQSGAGSRWIVGFVLVGAGALLSATVGRDYLAGARGMREVTTSDVRTEEWVTYGQNFLAEGDLPKARTEFERALAAADSEPGALLGMVRVELLSADTAWLARFFLRGSTADVKQTNLVQAEFDARLLRLKTAIDVLRTRAAGLAEAQIYLADALRIQGDVAAARRLLPQVVQPVSHPDVAYALALLDLAEAEGNFDPIALRLTTVAAAERRPGRATAALIYALGRAGRRDDAQNRFAALTKPEPDLLWSSLASYLGSLKDEVAEAGSALPAAGSAELTAVASSVVSASPRSQKYLSQENTVTGSSYPEAILLAGRARGVHDYELAARHYSQALSFNPGSVEAMVGLGDMAKLQGRLAIASSHYGAALRQSPRSEIALRALGDLRWETGERASAYELYETMSPGQRGAQIDARMKEWLRTRRPEAAAGSRAGSLTGETDGPSDPAGNSQESP